MWGLHLTWNNVAHAVCILETEVVVIFVVIDDWTFTLLEITRVILLIIWVLIQHFIVVIDLTLLILNRLFVNWLLNCRLSLLIYWQLGLAIMKLKVKWRWQVALRDRCLRSLKLLILILNVEVTWSHLRGSFVIFLQISFLRLSINVSIFVVEISCRSIVMVQAFAINERWPLFLEFGELMLKWITFSWGSILPRLPVEWGLIIPRDRIDWLNQVVLLRILYICQVLVKLLEISLLVRVGLLEVAVLEIIQVQRCHH